jgi:FkbM family methyltransferase
LRHHLAFREQPLATTVRLLDWRVKCFLKRDVRCRFRGGFTLVLPPAWRGTAKLLFSYRDRFEPELRWVSQTLGPGDVFVDVGANLGVYTLAAAQSVGSGGLVLAFEPSDQVYSYLRRSIGLNRCANVVSTKLALSDTKGEARLYRSRIGSDSLESPGPDYDVVPTDTLDHVIDSYAPERIRCIKIDVEGAELSVLRGAEGTLRRYHPDVILEVNPDTQRFGSDEIAAALESFGYRFYRCSPAGQLIKLVSPLVDGNLVAHVPDTVQADDHRWKP